MEARLDGSPSPPMLFPSSPASNFSTNNSSSDDICMSRSGSVSSIVLLTSREESMNGEVVAQNGLVDKFPPSRIKKCDEFYNQPVHLTQSQLEVQEEFQKLQIQQLQQQLHQRQLQLQQTQKLLKQHKHMEVDEVQSNSLHDKEMGNCDVDSGMFKTGFLMPLIENRENLTENHVGNVVANHINGANSDDFEPKTQSSLLPRCYSVGSTGLSHLHKRPLDVFKRKENFLSNNKLLGNVNSDSHTSHLKHSLENLKRHHRSENGGSFSPPSSTLTPIDLTCKRKRSLEIGVNSEDDHSIIPSSHRSFIRDHHSILKSVLTSSSPSIEVGGRLRSHTLSVCSLQGLRRSGASSAHTFSDSRRVTLAKKNLAPVQRFVIDQLKEIVKFACRQPDFNQLPMADKKALLVQAGPRLLLLYMAELNFKFAVTLVWEPLEKTLESSEKLEPKEKARSSSKDTAPTQRFIETIQNFIVKCQSQSITAEEYFYMRLIVLFHIGSEPLNENRLVAKRHNEAQQDLQTLLISKLPSDRLRYSKLLLTIYTLFGVDGVLVENLFYSSENHCGMAEFLCKELECAGSKPPQFPVSDAQSM